MSEKTIKSEDVGFILPPEEILERHRIRDEETWRRTLRSIERYVEPERILQMIEEGRPWPYRRNPEYYITRDKGLMAFIYMMGCRINEAGKVLKDQIDFEDPDYPRFIVVKDFKISKRKKKTIRAEGIPRIDFGLPRSGRFSPFTDLFLEWYDLTPGPEIFKISRVRSWQIIEHHTGKWCHWFRSQRFSWMINRLRSVVIVANMFGVKNPATIMHYYKGSWAEHRDEINQ